MIVSTFSVLDKDDRERFFEESFLFVNIKSDVILEMSFLTMSNADVDFQAWDWQYRSYTTENVLPNTRWVELIGGKEFAVAAFDSKHKAFVVYIVALSVDLNDEIHSSKKAQIAYLNVDEVSTKVLSKYADFADVFPPRLAIKLSEPTRIKNYAIELVDD